MGPSRTQKLQWPRGAGVGIAVAGLTLLVMTMLSVAGPPLLWSALAFVVSAMLEFAGGQSLLRRGGAGISHLIIGGVAAALCAGELAVWLVYPDVFSAPVVTMLLGVFFASTSIACACDLFIDRPQALLAQAMEVGVTFGLAALALSSWRAAAPPTVATLVGIDLLFGGLALAATVAALHRYPDDTPYHGYPERLTSGTGG